MMTTGKRCSADFKAKVALEAIGGDLTLAKLGAKHGIHHTMIAAWKRQAIDGMVSTFAGASEGGAGERRSGRSTSCIPRSGNWSWNGIF